MRKNFWGVGGLFSLLILLLASFPVEAREAWTPVPRNVSFFKGHPGFGSYDDSLRGGYIGLGVSVPHGARIDIAGEVLPYINIVAHFSWFGSNFDSEGGSVLADGIPFNWIPEAWQPESVYWGEKSALIASQWSAGLLLEVITPIGLYARGGLMWMDNQTRWAYNDAAGDRKTLKPIFKSLIPYSSAGPSDITGSLDSHLFPYLALGLRTSAGPFLFGIEAGVILTDAVRALIENDNFDGVFVICDLDGKNCGEVPEATLKANRIPSVAVRAIQFLPSIALTIAYRF